MTEIGDKSTCNRCLEEKKIFCITKIKRYDQSEDKTFLCEECFNDMCFCVICLEKTNYSSYEQHLLDKHTKEEMAKQLLNEKVSSNSL